MNTDCTFCYLVRFSEKHLCLNYMSFPYPISHFILGTCSHSFYLSVVVIPKRNLLPFRFITFYRRCNSRPNFFTLFYVLSFYNQIKLSTSPPLYSPPLGRLVRPSTLLKVQVSYSFRDSCFTPRFRIESLVIRIPYHNHCQTENPFILYICNGTECLVST